MAISVVQNTSVTAAPSSGTSATTAATFTSNTTVGNCLVACIYLSGPFGDTPALTSVTTNGSAENWAQAVTQIDTAGGGDVIFIWTDPNTGGGQKIIDVNWTFGGTASSTNTGFILVDTYEISGLATSSVVDKTASATNTGTTAFSSGATGTTTQASEIAVGMIGAVQNAGSTMTVTGPASPWTNETTRNVASVVSGSTFQIYEKSGYDILSATGTATYSGTLSTTSSQYAAAVVTLKAASSGNTSTAAMGFNPAMAASVTVANPVTSTGAMAFNLAMAASGLVPFTSTAAMSFNPAMAASVSVANPVTATGAMSFNPHIAATASTVPPVTATAAMAFNLAMSASATTAVPSPLMTLAGEVTVDPYGNVVPAGLYVYGPDSSYTALVDNGVTSAIKFSPPSVTSVTTNPQVASFASNPGTSTEFEWLLMTSGKENGNSDAAIQLTSQNANATGSPEIIFEFGGTAATILTPTGGFSAGAWQTASLVNSWTGSSEGVNGFYYRMLPFGMVEILADIINTTATGNSTCYTLPSGFIPGTAVMNFPAGWNNPQSSNAASAPWVNITNTGVVQITGIQVADKGIFFHLLVPIVNI